MGLSNRLQRLERSLDAAEPADPAAHRPSRAFYERLAAAGLVRWDPEKDYWSPVDYRAFRQFLDDLKRERGL